MLEMNPYIKFEKELRDLFKEENHLTHSEFGLKFANIIIRIKKLGKEGK